MDYYDDQNYFEYEGNLGRISPDTENIESLQSDVDEYLKTLKNGA